MRSIRKEGGGARPGGTGWTGRRSLPLPGCPSETGYSRRSPCIRFESAKIRSHTEPETGGCAGADDDRCRPTGPQPVRTGLSCRGSSLRDSHTETTAASIRAVKESKTPSPARTGGKEPGRAFGRKKRASTGGSRPKTEKTDLPRWPGRSPGETGGCRTRRPDFCAPRPRKRGYRGLPAAGRPPRSGAAGPRHSPPSASGRGRKNRMSGRTKRRRECLWGKTRRCCTARKPQSKRSELEAEQFSRTTKRKQKSRQGA